MGTRSGGAQKAVSCPDFHLKVLPLHFSYQRKMSKLWGIFSFVK